MTALLGDRYRPLGRIATGGMGEVWRARDELLDREVAVKLLHRHVATDPAFRERFRMEAKITARLAAPGIAQVFDYGEADDLAYLVMELVPGESLANILTRDGALGPEATLDVIEQAATGLLAAHSAGVIHRDIKPGNLLVTEAGVVKITDFGIARALEAARMTRTGTLVGTAQYLSPEQALGEPLTYASDVYSLGVVAYECLAGRPPFLADTQVAVALMHVNGSPPPLPESVPEPIRELVMACLSKDPERRPGDGGELSTQARALREPSPAPAASGLSTLTNPSGWRVEPATEWPREVAPFPAAPGGDDGGAVPVPMEGPPTELRRRERRRKTMIFAVTTGCAAAVGLGTLLVQDWTDHTAEEGRRGPTTPVSSSASPPAPQASATARATPRPAVPPAKWPRPTPTPSATVSTSATPSAQPTNSPPPSPSPSPSISTPTPTTPPATPPLPPSTTPIPGDANQLNGEM